MNDFDIDRFIKESNAIENILEADSSSVFITGQKRALEYALSLRFPIELDHILEIHRLLMENTGLEDRCVGKIRDCLVYVGGRVCPSPVKIEKMLLDLCGEIDSLRKNPTTCHFEFEYIHPFVDGNGRSGRILLAAHENLAYGKPLTLYTYKERDKYYDDIIRYCELRSKIFKPSL